MKNTVLQNKSHTGQSVLRDCSSRAQGTKTPASHTSTSERCVSAVHTPSALLKVFACMLMAVMLVGAVGCRDTDALKEIIYDQNSDLIDYDNPSKFYINDSSAEEENSSVSALEVSDEEPDTDQVQNLVVYSSEPNTEGFTAKQSLFSPFPDFVGIEASDTVYFYKSDSVDAVDHAVTPTPEEDEQEEQQEEEQQEQTSQTEGSTVSQDAAVSNSSAAGTETGSGTATTTEEDENGGTVGNDENPVESNEGTGGLSSTEGVGDYKDYTLAYDVTDRDADPPQADTIAAFGDYALIVQMIGGDGALAATDAETLAALQDAGVSTSAVAAWSGDGSDPSTLDVEALVATGVKYIVVEDPLSYTTQMSTPRVQYLEDAGVSWVSLRNMATSTNIKANVEIVGTMLQGSQTAAYGSSASTRASEYASKHDTLVANANGGLAYDSTENGARVLQSGEDADGLSYNTDSNATYTVLVDYWDASATISLTGLTFDSGAAFTSIGCSSTPLSYYMQAGGTINNAAARTAAQSSGQAPVLQFAGSYAWDASMWSNTSLGNIVYSVDPLLDTGYNLANTQLGQGLGTDAMPKLLVTSSAIKEAILENSAKSTSLYHAYSYTSNDLISGAIGLSYSAGNYGNTTLFSTIGSTSVTGTPGDANPTYPTGQIDEDDILVNPSGYFCDWTSGTVESFLEAGWIAAYVNGSYSTTQWQSDVQDFYSWAWGISVDMSKITDR